jgi:hypothetical protein
MLGLGGRKSRNKVIVGEPAIGSFLLINRDLLIDCTCAFLFNYFLNFVLMVIVDASA